MLLEILGALSEAIGIAKPFVEETFAQKYEKSFHDRVQELQGILQEGDSSKRADRLNDYFKRLCIDAGTPVGGLGENISIPMAYVVALATISAGKIKDDSYLAKFTQKLTLGEN